MVFNPFGHIPQDTGSEEVGRICLSTSTFREGKNLHIYQYPALAVDVPRMYSRLFKLTLEEKMVPSPILDIWIGVKLTAAEYVNKVSHPNQAKEIW
jgi:hypothetical protein